MAGDDRSTMDFYLGEGIVACYAGYSADSGIQAEAAAGGIVSGVLIELLRRHEIDGALVCRTLAKHGKIDYDVKIATTAEEVLECAKSAYWDIPILKDLNRIKNFDGKLAIVGLPCHMSRLKRMCEKDESLNRKIVYKIGLFCGGNNKKELLAEVVKHHGIREEDIRQILFHRKHVKGVMEVVLNDGNTTVIPFHHFNIYRMLHFYSKKLCTFCADHTAEAADLSVGDIFTKEYKQKSIKYSSIICRTPKAHTLMKDLIREGKVIAEEVENATIFASQKKSLIYRKNMSARKLVAAKVWKMKLPFSTKTRVRWNDLLVAFCYLLNEKLSEKAWFQRIIFHIPKPILYAYIVTLKFLSSF